MKLLRQWVRRNMLQIAHVVMWDCRTKHAEPGRVCCECSEIIREMDLYGGKCMRADNGTCNGGDGNRLAVIQN